MKIARILHICLCLILISCGGNTQTRGQPQTTSGNIGYTPNPSQDRQARIDALNAKIDAMQAHADEIIKDPYASQGVYPVTMPTAASRNGWVTSPLGTETKDGPAGSGEIATLQKVAILEVKTWIYNDKINRFIQRKGTDSQYRCNPRNPEGHPKSLFGTACEAALDMRVGGKKYVIPPMFSHEGQPQYAMEIELQQIEPITDGFLSPAEAEKYREDTLSGKFIACESTWRSRSDQARKDGLNPNISPHLVVMLNAYISDMNCPILGKNFFLQNRQVQQIIAKAPPYVPGRSYDIVKLAEWDPVQNVQEYKPKAVVKKQTDSSNLDKILDNIIGSGLKDILEDAAHNGGHFESGNSPSIDMGDIHIYEDKSQYYQYPDGSGAYGTEHY